MKLAFSNYGGAFMPDFDNSLRLLISASFIVYTLTVVVLIFQVMRTNIKLKSLETSFHSLATASQVQEVVTKLDKGFCEALSLSEENIVHSLDDIVLNVKNLQKQHQITADTATRTRPEHIERDKISEAVEYARAGYGNDEIVKILQLNLEVVEEITKFNRSH
jgi:hypothetical protein